jgi:hypothetical protein
MAGEVVSNVKFQKKDSIFADLYSSSICQSDLNEIYSPSVHLQCIQEVKTSINMIYMFYIKIMRNCPQRHDDRRPNDEIFDDEAETLIDFFENSSMENHYFLIIHFSKVTIFFYLEESSMPSDIHRKIASLACPFTIFMAFLSFVLHDKINAKKHENNVVTLRLACLDVFHSHDWRQKTISQQTKVEFFYFRILQI